ncbi:hypothetical protein ABK040_010200 [Willaertia magna]
MFYSEFILTKKGPLANVWLAAHWDKKLTKQQIASFDLRKSVKGIIDPQVPIALRTNGHLLLGVVKIYSRKVKYVLAECNETLTKIKLQLKTRDTTDENITLAPQHSTANRNQITLPEVTDLDLLLLPNAATITLEVGDWQSRIQDITLTDFDTWYTEESVEPSITEAKGVLIGEQAPIALEEQAPLKTPEPGSIEAQRAASTKTIPSGISGVSTAVGGVEPEFNITFPELLPEELTKVPSPTTELGGLEAIPFQEEVIPPTEVVPTEGIPPVEVPPTVEEEQPKKRKRHGKLQYDEPASLESRHFTKRVKEHHDLLTTRKKAPATREEYEKKEKAPPKDIWRSIPFGFDYPSGFLDLFNKSLDNPNWKVAPTEIEIPAQAISPVVSPVVPTTTTPGPMEQQLTGVTPVLEEHLGIEIGGIEGLGGLEVTPGPVTEVTAPSRRKTMGGEVSPMIEDLSLEEDVNNMLIETVTSSHIRKEKTPLTETEKLEIITEQRKIEQELREQATKTPEEITTPGLVTPSPVGVTDRTLRILAMLQEGFKRTESDELSLTDMIRGRKKNIAAKCFYETLVLKSKGLIDVEQNVPYGEIRVMKVE